MFSIHRSMGTMLLFLITLNAGSQTQVDIQRQAKGLESLQPPFAMPLRQGDTLPATCAVNELFFLTSAPAGGNIHVCHASDSWAPQGSATQGFVTVMNDGSTVGVRPTVNFVPGQGLGQIVTDLGSQVNVQQSLDTALLLSRTRAQSGEVLLCASAGASATSYTCSMTPSLQALDTGMLIHWVPDVSSGAGAPTLSIDSFPPAPLRLADGLTVPRDGDFTAGRLYPLWYDGTVFRALQGPLVQNLQTVEEQQSGAAIFCDSASVAGSDFTCGVQPPLQNYHQGMVLLWRPDQDSSGYPITLAVDGLAAAPLRQSDGTSDFEASELQGGNSYWVWWDGSQFRLASFLPVGLASAESLQSGLLSLQSGEAIRCVSAGTTGNAFSCSLDPALGSYSDGLVIYWVPDEDAAGGTATLNVDGLGAAAITRADGVTGPAALDFLAGQMYPLWYDGLQFRLPPVNQTPAAVRVEDPRPDCEEALRGKLWLVPGGVDVADLFAVCTKDNLNSYEWRTLLP